MSDNVKEMITSRDDVLRELAWQERVAFVGATSEVRASAATEVQDLRRRLHLIEEERQVRAARRTRFLRSRIAAVGVLLTAFSTGMLTTTLLHLVVRH